MPQLTLEFSSNIFEKSNMTKLFKTCHAILAKALPTDLDSCKSRAIENDIYCVGDGELKNAFVHVNLKVMPGRADDTLKNVGDRIMLALKDYFFESLEQLQLQITLEIMELEKTYFKVTS